MVTDRERLTAFVPTPGEVTPQMDAWYRGEHFHRLPTKAQMREDGLMGILEGWRPPEPIIHPDTRVFAMGSCFASNFILWLGDQGFNRDLPAPYRAHLRNPISFEHVAALAQQFRWAFGEVESNDLLWIDLKKQLVEPTEERRSILRTIFEQAEVLILSLGISEIWYDRITGEPLWRTVPERYLDLNRHAFKVLSVSETVQYLETIERIRAQHAPRLKIVYTVSPIRMRATFRPISTLTANSASKAIVRAGLDEFLRAHWDQLFKTYFYFPSYEIAMDVIRDTYEFDNLHVHSTTVSQVLTLFAQQYTSLPVTRDRLVPDQSQLPEHHLLARIAALEDDLEVEQRANRERLVVIDELRQAADERLDLIRMLDRAATERLETINRLDALCREQEAHIRALEAERAASQPDTR